MIAAIRCDASEDIGSGHLMRCLVIAEQLKHLGWQVLFVVRTTSAPFIERITTQGYPVKQLPTTTPYGTEQVSEYQRWLGVPQLEDAKDFNNQTPNLDLVIVDHYGIELEWEVYVRTHKKCPLIAIDDLRRDHRVDLLIDSAPFQPKEAYSGLRQGQSSLLIGTDYALLRAEFSQARKTLDRRPLKEDDKLSVLVSFGAIDRDGVTLKVLEQLKLMRPQKAITATVLLSGSSPYYHEIRSFCQQHAWATHIGFSDNMAKLMQEHDIGIGAAGSTSLERACMGLPSIAIPIADNQAALAQSLQAHDICQVIDKQDLGKDLECALNTLVLRYTHYVNQSLALCDGRGVQRVINHIYQRYTANQESVCLRPVSIADEAVLLKWQQHPETRKYSPNPNPPSAEEHAKWIRKTLSRPGVYFYIIMWREPNRQQWQDAGMVRLEPDGDNQAVKVISIFTAPELYGRGIGSAALELIDQYHPQLTIKARVLAGNQASRRLFSRAGYQKVAEELFERIPIREEL